MSGPDSRTSWSTRLLLVMVLAAGLAVRIWLATQNTYPSVDGVHYMEQSRGLIRDGFLPFSSFPPGWPLLNAIPLLFLNAADSMHVLRCAQGSNVLFGSLLPLLTFLVLRRRLAGPWPLVGAVLLAALPANLISSKTDLSEMSYSCVLLAGWLVSERRLRAAGGLLLGYAYLIRPEAALAAAGLWLWHVVRERRIPWPYTLGALVPVVPYLIYVRVQSGHWSLSAKGVFLARSFGERSLTDLLRLMGGNLADLGSMSINLVGVPLILLALWGLWIGRGRWLLMLAPVLPLPLFDFVMIHRYWLPALPFLLLGAGLGGADLVRRAAARWPHHGRRIALATLAVAGLGGFAIAAWDEYPVVKLNPEGYRGLRDAGEWLAERVDTDTVVACYKPYVPFWAGCRFLQYPEGESDPALIVEYCRRHGAEYVIANVKIVHRFTNGLDPLLGSPLPAYLDRKLELVHLLQYDQTIQTTAIYRVKNPLPADAANR